MSENNELDVKIVPYQYLPCSLQVFKINGQSAEQMDFGEMADVDRFNAEPYSCGCMRFQADKSQAENCMKKYHITYEQFEEICDMLSDKLYVGSCGYCV